MKLIPGTVGGKIGVSVVLALILVGAVLVTSINGVTDGSSLMVKLFLIFLGAVIAVQVIPGMLLFGAMVKALSSLTRKETVKETHK